LVDVARHRAGGIENDHGVFVAGGGVNSAAWLDALKVITATIAAPIAGRASLV
jgi:hypothetical protein